MLTSLFNGPKEGIEDTPGYVYVSVGSLFLPCFLQVPETYDAAPVCFREQKQTKRKKKMRLKRSEQERDMKTWRRVPGLGPIRFFVFSSSSLACL